MDTFKAYLRFPEFEEAEAKAEWTHDIWVEIIALPENHFGFGLLGRDVLFCGELLYDGRKGKVTLTFSKPE